MLTSLASDAWEIAIYLSLVGAAWTLPLYALRLPAWIAPIAASAMMPWIFWEELPALVLAIPIAALACTLVSRVVFSRMWLLQLFSILIMLDLFAGALLNWREIAWLCAPCVGFCIGLAQPRSLQISINRFALTAFPVVIVAICMHRGIWGSAVEGDFFRRFATPLLCVAMLGVGAQIGAAVHRRIREQDLRRDAQVASREIEALIDRMGWGGVPA
ncbi:MAG TPA: hypothetical protein VHC73_10710 [Vitreimonas sp.]|jgi:hypothetical protein|nr:hypothetical protein [Vitreimonas sp.]